MKSSARVKYIFVTGGVVSSLGKGIASASLGMLLKSRKLKVTLQKFDPYLNVDPGTLSPFQHGEVFVTDDGAETDLDLGHYERFIDESLSQDNNVTAGRVYHSIITKERVGDYLGATVQVVPHVTDEIKSFVKKVAGKDDVDVVITEIGGTVGDIESLPFLEALRQIRLEMGPTNVLFMHLTLIPFIKVTEELKTKPTQHSVRELRSIGIQPDVLLCRTEYPLTEEVREKIGLFCNVPPEMVIEARDTESIYKVPLMLHREGLDQKVIDNLNIDAPEPDLVEWGEIVNKIENPEREVEISVCGKYVEYQDSYKSIKEAFVHAGTANNVRVNVDWVDTEKITSENAHRHLSKYAGILIPGGFGPRGVDGMIEAVRYARENKVPFFGICLGLHSAVIEFARNVCGLSDSHSSEFDNHTKNHVIDLMPEQNGVVSKGGTMRLGSYPCQLAEGTLARRIYGVEMIDERHRHRYEVNNKYLAIFQEKGIVLSGRSPDRTLTEMIELKDHPWFIACQFHPEFKSRPTNPHPLFRDFVRAAMEYEDGAKRGARG